MTIVMRRNVRDKPVIRLGRLIRMKAILARWICSDQPQIDACGDMILTYRERQTTQYATVSGSVSRKLTTEVKIADLLFYLVVVHAPLYNE